VKEHRRKLRTSRGSPRHMRLCTAKASRISRQAVKSGCAREWGGWGRISEDGPGQNNPDRSEGPWGRAAESARTEVFTSASSLIQRRESRSKQRARRAMSNQVLGRPRLKFPALKPYRGKPVRNFRGAMETSASFEARYAPLSYPTKVNGSLRLKPFSSSCRRGSSCGGGSGSRLSGTSPSSCLQPKTGVCLCGSI
jgi:hypothetical protein